VHAPDLYDGKTFTNLNDGVHYAKEVGFGTMMERGLRAADSLPNSIVYAGFSLGVMPAQKLAQTRPGATGPCCSTRVLRPPSSAARGRKASRSRST